MLYHIQKLSIALFLVILINKTFFCVFNLFKSVTGNKLLEQHLPLFIRYPFFACVGEPGAPQREWSRSPAY